MTYAAYHEIGGPSGLLATLKAFEGNTMSASWNADHTVYRVYSYNTCIAEYHPFEDGGTLHATVPTYSVTSARHQSLARAWTARYNREHEVEWFDLNRGAYSIVPRHYAEAA